MTIELCIKTMQTALRVMESAINDRTGWLATNGDDVVELDVHVEDRYVVMIPRRPIAGDSICITHHDELMWVEPDGLTGLAWVPGIPESRSIVV